MPVVNIIGEIRCARNFKESNLFCKYSFEHPSLIELQQKAKEEYLPDVTLKPTTTTTIPTENNDDNNNNNNNNNNNDIMKKDIKDDIITNNVGGAFRSNWVLLEGKYLLLLYNYIITLISNYIKTVLSITKFINSV